MKIFIISIYLFLIIFLIKNENTNKQQTKIIKAIKKYNIHIIDECYSYEEYKYMSISYDCIESYNKTLLRFWDWGNKRIVPKEVYEKIKIYL